MGSAYDSHYKARVKDAVLKAIVRESLQPIPGGGRTARVKLAEAFDGAIEALAMLSTRAQRLRAELEDDDSVDASHLSQLMAAAKGRTAIY